MTRRTQHLITKVGNKEGYEKDKEREKEKVDSKDNPYTTIPTTEGFLETPR